MLPYTPIQMRRLNKARMRRNKRVAEWQQKAFARMDALIGNHFARFFEKPGPDSTVH